MRTNLLALTCTTLATRRLAEVKDILLVKSGKADKAILSVGGFLG